MEDERARAAVVLMSAAGMTSSTVHGDAGGVTFTSMPRSSGLAEVAVASAAATVIGVGSAPPFDTVVCAVGSSSSLFL